MNTKITHRPWQAALALIFMLACGAAISAEPESPAQIVEDAAGSLLDDIDARRDEFQDDPAALRALVREKLIPMFDQEYSARLILGRHGRGLPNDQIRAFADALSTALTDRYSTGLLGFSSKEQLEVLPPNANDSERLTRVRTRIKLPNGGFAPVDYAFRKSDDGWKVFDVTVEGISYVLTFRNQLAPKVASQGIEKVTADLLAGHIQVADS